MRRQQPIAAFILAAAVCLMPLGRSAELVTLRNGFQMQCDHHAAAGGYVRVYLTSGDDNYIELPPSQIASVSHFAVPALPSSATGPQPAIQPASAERGRRGARRNFHPRISRAKPVGFGPGGMSQGQASQFASAQPALTSADLRQMLASAGRSHNLDVDLLASVVHAESGGNPHAVSRAGARGLMQLMPATAAALGVRNSFQPRQNVGGGSAYLDALLTRYSGNLALALAAYNAGPESVDHYRGIPPYPETRAYVARVIHEFNRRVLARRAAAMPALPRKLQAPVSQK